MQLIAALIGFFIGKKNWQRDQEIKKIIQAEDERKKKEEQDKLTTKNTPPKEDKE